MFSSTVRRRTAGAALALALAVACGSDEPSGSRGTAAGTPSTSATASAAVASPLGSVSATPVTPRVEKRLEIAGNPDYVATSSDSVWVKTDSGVLKRLDPKSYRELASIAVSDGLCQGLGVAGDEVWTCNGKDIVRVDPTTNKVVKSVPVEKADSQGNLAVASGHVWVLSGALGNKLLGVSSTTNAVDVTIDLGHSCRDLAATGTALWVMCAVDGVVLRVDPAGKSVVATVPGMPGVDHGFADDTAVFVAYTDGIARIDPATNSLSRAVAVKGPGQRLLATADALWVRTDGHFLRRLDPATLELREELSAPEKSGGSMAFGFGSLWTTAYDDDVLYRIKPA